MANRLLTQGLIEREAVHVLHCFCGVPWDLSREVSVVQGFRPATDQERVSIMLRDRYVEFDVTSKDLAQSLDDFSDRMLRPALSKLADYLGYATWD